jgi:hypothetical protein
VKVTVTDIIEEPLIISSASCHATNTLLVRCKEDIFEIDQIQNFLIFYSQTFKILHSSFKDEGRRRIIFKFGFGEDCFIRRGTKRE